jgi:hypothetical protein
MGIPVALTTLSAFSSEFYMGTVFYAHKSMEEWTGDLGLLDSRSKALPSLCPNLRFLWTL